MNVANTAFKVVVHPKLNYSPHWQWWHFLIHVTILGFQRGFHPMPLQRKPMVANYSTEKPQKKNITRLYLATIGFHCNDIGQNSLLRMVTWIRKCHQIPHQQSGEWQMCEIKIFGWTSPLSATRVLVNERRLSFWHGFLPGHGNCLLSLLPISVYRSSGQRLDWQ